MSVASNWSSECRTENSISSASEKASSRNGTRRTLKLNDSESTGAETASILHVSVSQLHLEQKRGRGASSVDVEQARDV